MRRTPAAPHAVPHAATRAVQSRVGDDSLTQELCVHNPGPGPLTFTAALHTYFR